MREVIFALLPHNVLLDVVGPAEAFRMANAFAPDSYSLRYIASTRTVESAIGLQVSGLEPLPQSVAPGSIIVIAGVTTKKLDFESPAATKLARWLRDTMKDETVSLMCVCSGSVFAGRAGVLDGLECTTHHVLIDDLQRMAPKARVHANRVFVEAGRVFTSAGVTAGIDLALHIIGQQQGHRVAAAVARDLVVYLRREGADPQLSPWVMHRNHLHPVVHRVQDAVSRNPAADWPAHKLANLAHTSERNLARLFAQHAACSPLDYVQRMRIGLAREILSQSDVSIDRVAELAGFSSAHQFRRVWRRWESRPPSCL